MSSKDLINKAKVYSSGHASLHATPTHSADVYKKHVSGVLVPTDHHVCVRQKVVVRANPTSSINANLLDGGQIDFRLEKGSIDLITHAYLVVDVTNSTGLSLTLAPIQTCINRILIHGENGSRLLSTIYGQELMLTNCFFSRNEIEQMENYIGLGANYSTTGNVIANGDSASFYLPLVHLLQNAKLHLAGLRSELLIQVYFEQSNLTLLAGSVPTTNNCTLLMKGFSETPQQIQKRKEVYNGSVPLLIPFFNFERQKQTLTLAASSTYDIVLSGIRGISAGIFFTIRDAAVTAVNQSDYQAVESYDLTTSSGESMIGFYRMLDADFKLDSAETFNNLMATYKDFYFIAFSENPTYDYKTGSNSGYQVFTGFEKLSFTTPSTLVPGSFIVDILSLSHEHLVVNKGSISSTRS